MYREYRCPAAHKIALLSCLQVGTGATVATLADASELPGTVTVAQVNYSTVQDGEVRTAIAHALFGKVGEILFPTSH